jgi:NAD(P)H-flavin reductase
LWLSDPPPGWSGETGRVTAEVLGRLIPRDRNTRQSYVCGPDPMMDSVEAALTRLGVSLANSESERYNFI